MAFKIAHPGQFQQARRGVNMAGNAESWLENSSLDAKNLRRKVFWMNEAFEDDCGWPWHWKLLIFLLIAGFFCTLAIPNYIGGGPNEEPSPIINNLREIDGAKNEWAFERGFTNESQVIQLTNQLTEEDLFSYIHRNPNKPNDLVVSAAGEIYTIGGFNTGPQAKLTKKIKLRNETWPKGTIIRFATDPDSGMPYQVIFPNGTKKHFDILK